MDIVKLIVGAVLIVAMTAFTVPEQTAQGMPTDQNTAQPTEIQPASKSQAARGNGPES